MTKTRPFDITGWALSAVLFLSMAALVFLGVESIWSAGHAREVIFHGMWKDTLFTALFGLVVYTALAWFDYRRYFNLAALPVYIGSVGMLVLVLVAGSTVLGGRRWLWFFQPSEISKIAVIMMLAWLFGSRERPAWLDGFKGFVVAMALFGVPALLILLEPDLGTVLALVPAVTLIVIAADVWRRGFLVLLVAGVGAVALLLGAVGEMIDEGVGEDRREEIAYYVVRDPEKPHAWFAPLRPHQLKRVKTFLDPESDPMGSGYNLREAKIAIGSGGYSGKGLGKGETNRMKYLPPAVSMNDFIFCVYAEERGFVGSLVLLSIFGVMFLAGVAVAVRATDLKGRLAALGLTALVFAHVYVNIGMSIGLVPITGLPLPFISSGRTFLLVVMSGLGIIQSISLHREEIE